MYIQMIEQFTIILLQSVFLFKKFNKSGFIKNIDIANKEEDGLNCLKFGITRIV